MTSDPLEIALAAQRPIDDSPRQPLEVERLLSESQRRLEADDAAADPIHDHRPASRPQHKARSVLSILDQLDQETPTRRFNP